MSIKDLFRKNIFSDFCDKKEMSEFLVQALLSQSDSSPQPT